MLCALLATSLLLLATAQSSPIVTTPCGAVLGVVQPLYDSSGSVAIFRSIRYANPPTGAARWEPPVAAACWSGTYNATVYNNYCVQSGGDGDEDCLFLTVFVPLSAQGALPPANASRT